MKKIIISGAITLGILGICGYSAFAVTTPQNNNTSIQTQQQYCNLGHLNCNLTHSNDTNNTQYCNLNHENCNLNHNNGYNGQHHNNGNGCHNAW
ncbi:hypothetical protein [Clostridium perfringens]|uniref:hypothetical protein n=1 Tax=Clostridium perfringens TaxID=1502 RepID=UPI0024BCD284|nr:hypothetical protein [Clostridium perfringens]